MQNISITPIIYPYYHHSQPIISESHHIIQLFTLFKHKAINHITHVNLKM